MIKKLVLSILALLLVVNTASAAVYYLNGTVIGSDSGSGISGVAVTQNVTNSTTTDATGFFSLPNVNNGAQTLTFKANGYTAIANTTVIAGANNYSNQTMTIITPTITVTDSGVTRTEATIAGTITATDGVNNNYVGTRVRYSKDSGLTTNVWTTAWSNTTTSPSFTLSNLDLGVKWYYSIDTYNRANEAYTASATGDFTTLKGIYDETQDASNYAPGVVQQAQNQGALISASIVEAQNQAAQNERNRNIVIFILVIGGIYYLFLRK